MADIVRAIGEVVGAVREGPDINRPPGVVYAKCALKYSLSGAWAFGTAYILGKYNADPQQMINIFQKIALPAGVILMGMSTGCLKLSLQADSLSSLKELWKRYTKGVLQNDLRQALLTPDLLHFVEAGQNVELEVQIDEKIYQEACLDLMVKTVLQDKQNDRNTSSLYRRSLSESNIAVYQINKELFLQAKPRDLKQEKQPTTKVIDEPLLEVTTYKTPEEDTHVSFLSVDNGKVFDKVQRISNGEVEMLARTTSQISGIKVWVFREAEAAKLCGDKQGRQELPVKIRKQEMYGTHFSVNLDEVYNGPEGPFYALSKVDPNRRNLFQLSTMLYFIDGAVSKELFSKPFHIRKIKTRTRARELAETEESIERRESGYSEV